MAKFVSYSKKINDLSNDLKTLLYKALRKNEFDHASVIACSLAECYGVEQNTGTVLIENSLN